MTNSPQSLKDILNLKKERGTPSCFEIFKTLKIRLRAENRIYQPLQRQLGNQFIPDFFEQVSEDLKR